MDRPRILIASPAAAADNNGNWQTASRWARFLRGPYAVTVAGGWNVNDPAPDLLVALHARRSAQALASFKAAYPERPALLVLTGTDLYRDIDSVPEARASLDLADALVVLQEAGLARLPAPVRSKARVIYQSAPPLSPAPPATKRYVDICMIGHLRQEKDPQTFMRAAALVTTPGVRLLHIGGVLDPILEQAARDTAAATSRYRWLGPLPHARTRQRLKRCHAMVIASRMEGGANVIIEAVSSGVPVLASRIDGNVGMLGPDYAGYFDAGDAGALAALIERCVFDPDFDALLRRQCAARAGLFLPAAERALLTDLVDNLLPAPRTA
ncbi:selenoneine biosynthesis selenosugar synthase SenB [Massilia suwonensis]|uniref:Selenoneine biosynthesis selenosugar synthase SenB n=1 Tax=Massilia suwonensis TaxID=648895 RepID=A0ABW0MRW8_9BURK